MIDTDKYEGHTEGKWRWYEGARHKTLIGVMLFGEDGNNVHPKSADAQLMADAPLLLAEVKRLRGIAKTCLEAIEAGGGAWGTMSLIETNLKIMMEMKE